ncbi:hypothetical protein VZT92_024535 [Zoarces viviparus]|uniref:Uncharacterized protein n=1 Tax=Zoarces viviparus TaxID=48416 RepID=A0AAW1E474_ZOAVI
MSGEDNMRQWWCGWWNRDVRLPRRIEMKETGRIEPGAAGRDERDADNTSCNIDEEAEGKGRVVVEAAWTAWCYK